MNTKSPVTSLIPVCVITELLVHSVERKMRSRCASDFFGKLLDWGSFQLMLDRIAQKHNENRFSYRFQAPTVQV